MTTRNLTDIFFLLRNNAIQTRKMYDFEQQGCDVKQPLLDVKEESSFSHKLPTDWLNSTELIKKEITSINGKIGHLDTLHEKHIFRPTIDDSREEKEIEELTCDILQSITNCKEMLFNITSNHSANNYPAKQKTIIKNFTSSSISSLQDLTIKFRSKQSSYLKKIKEGEEFTRHFFDDSNCLNANSSAIMPEHHFNESNDSLNFNQPVQKMDFLEENQQELLQREKEVKHVLNSITELNSIFKDLAQIISDQGSMVDRIDCNIEVSSSNVDSSLKQLHKAYSYKKSNQKLYIIIFLFLFAIILFFCLLLFKNK